jgi:hypothetical protein
MGSASRHKHEFLKVTKFLKLVKKVRVTPSEFFSYRGGDMSSGFVLLSRCGGGEVLLP